MTLKKELIQYIINVNPHTIFFRPYVKQTQFSREGAEAEGNEQQLNHTNFLNSITFFKPQWYA